MNVTVSRPLWSFFATMFVVAFALNWLWEVAQVGAYADMPGRGWREAAIHCAIPSLGDVALTLSIYSVGSLAAGDWCWSMKGKWNVYATSALLGAACATAVEWRGLALGRWSYNDQMPIVPLLDVGLWPLLQLTLLVPAAAGIALWCSGRPAAGGRAERK